MSWVERLFRPHPELPEQLAERLLRWRALPELNDAVPFDRSRFVLVDVETTGLDARRDQLLSIGAIPVDGMSIRAGAGFSALVRADSVSTENILVHGITPGQQARGTKPEEALIGFLEYAQRDVLVAFHAPFDQAVLDRATRQFLGVRLGNPWIDLAELAPALFPEARAPRASLDYWLHYFGLRVAQRHQAAHDAFASAELFLILLSRARKRGLGTVSAVRAACEQQARLLPGGAGGM